MYFLSSGVKGLIGILSLPRQKGHSPNKRKCGFDEWKLGDNQETTGLLRLSLPRVISISNSPCSLTRNITSHSTKNLAFHSLLRWKMIILPILTMSLITFIFNKKFGECWYSVWEQNSPSPEWSPAGLFSQVCACSIFPTRVVLGLRVPLTSWWWMASSISRWRLDRPWASLLDSAIACGLVPWK